MLLLTEILSFAVTYYNLLKREVHYDVSKRIEFLMFRAEKIKVPFFLVTTLTLKVGVAVFFFLILRMTKINCVMA